MINWEKYLCVQICVWAGVGEKILMGRSLFDVTRRSPLEPTKSLPQCLGGSPYGGPSTFELEDRCSATSPQCGPRPYFRP